jgi:hypothetical protein
MDGVLRWRQNGDWGWRGGAVTATERSVSVRVDRALRRLEGLVDWPISQGDRVGPAPTPALQCELRTPAGADALDEAELSLGAVLPADYRRFLLRTNGALLSSPAPHGDCLCLLGTHELIRHAETAEVGPPERCSPDLILFATIGDQGDGLAFDLARLNPYGGCPVLDARAGRRNDQWWIIACDFTSWLHAMLRETCPSGSFGRDWSQPEQLPLPFDDGSPPWFDDA